MILSDLERILNGTSACDTGSRLVLQAEEEVCVDELEAIRIDAGLEPLLAEPEAVSR